MMKSSKKIALSGMISALAVVIMLIAYFPYLTYALPAIAGVLFSVIMIEINSKWALGSFASAAILSLVLCEKESSFLFVAFFGYYPVLKAYLERIPSRVVEYIVKFIVFNAATVASYLVIIYVFRIPIEDMGAFGRYTILILLGMGNVMFVVYDMAVSKLIDEYMFKLHRRVGRMLK